MGGPDDRFGVASVTRITALPCLGRVSALKGVQLKGVSPQLRESSREELLLRLIRFDWFRFRAALSRQPALLVGLVTVTRRGRRASAGNQIYAAATAACHSAVASARKIRSVDREMRWR